MDDSVKKYLSKLGKKGGGKRSPAQAEQFRKFVLGKGGAKPGNQNWKGRLKNAKKKDRTSEDS